MINLQLLNKINFVLLIISYFYLSYIKIFSIFPYHIFFLFIGVLINLNKLNYVINYLDKRLFIFFILLIIITSKLYILHPSKEIFKNLIDTVIIFSLIFYIFSFVKNEKVMIFFEKTIIFISVISISIAIFQFFNFEFAWKLREFMNLFAVVDKVVFAQIEQKLRPTGLAHYSITYSYQMLIVSSLLFSNYFNQKSKKNSMLTLFGFIGLIVCLARSAIFGYIFALVFILIFKHFKSKNFIFLILIISVLFLIFLNQDRKELINTEDLHRYYLFLSGLNVFWDHFFIGIGGQNMTDLTSVYAFDYGIPSEIITQSLHNSLLSPVVKHGFLMFVPIIYLYYIIFSNLKLLKYENFRLYVFFYIYIISYTFHSFFHNAGIFTGDQLFWIIFSYLIVVRSNYKINNNKKK